MKSEKGITLISLTVYIIVMVIVVGIIGVISKYFYTNTNSLSKTMNPLTEYTKFNSFFSEEVNHPNLKVLACETKYKDENEQAEIDSSYIVFDNKVQYSYIAENKGIYRNLVKIGKEIEKCVFKSEIKNGKNVVVVHIKIGTAKEKTIEYTLKN